ncbi:MAG: DUF554 domain-containing protein [Clostridia bacterium]|nr:DUF554 domain-containing protein [Clostridia bacterium]
MIGSLINFAAILVGSGLGLLLRGGISQRFRDTLIQGLALCVILIGTLGAIRTQDVMIPILCMVVGGLAGEAINIEKRLEALGDRAQRLVARASKGESRSGFSQGFVTASLVYCVGAMAIVGAMDSGLRGDHTTLIAKSALDGITAVIFASTMGAGVALSAVAVLVYQGVIALGAQQVAGLLTDGMILEMSAVGGLLIAGIGINMLGLTKLRIGNLLPAIFLPPACIPLMRWISQLF